MAKKKKKQKRVISEVIEIGGVSEPGMNFNNRNPVWEPIEIKGVSDLVEPGIKPRRYLIEDDSKRIGFSYENGPIPTLTGAL